MGYLNQILRNQFDAALCMFNQCIAACPQEHWEGKIANGTFRWVAYHTLFFVDLYLSPSEDAFELRELHRIGGDEREPVTCIGLNKDETLAYVPICRAKMIQTIDSETPESLAGPSGFSYRKFSRGELHINNIRHVQHHGGQLSAYLRRAVPTLDHGALPWSSSGWREVPVARTP